RRADGRFRWLGHADQLRLADRGASRGASRCRHVRCLAHDRGRPAWRACARLPAAPAGQQCRQAQGARQGAVFVHAERARWRGRRSDRVFPRRGTLPAGGQCRHPRQGPGLDREAGHPVRGAGEGAPRVRDDRGARSARAGEVARPRIEKLGKFAAAAAQGPHGMPLFVARTGYTGEDGFEIIVPQEHAVALWEALHAAGVAPAGLGARDTLRLEAGMNLYGQDMDESVTPWEANLGWTVSLDEGRAFIGRAALEQQKAAGVPRVMVGLVLDGKGVLRHGQKVLAANGEGEILSGSFAPTLDKAIAFARIPAGDAGDLSVDIRGREVPVRQVK